MFSKWKTIPTRLKILRYQLYEAASKKDHSKLSMLLCNNKFDVMNNEDLGKSALDVAASQGDYIAVELLLAHGAIPDYKRPKHVWTKSTLSRAILSGNLKVIQLLVNQGCDPDTELVEYNSYNFEQKERKVPLLVPFNYWYKIVELDALSVFQMLLEYKGRKIVNNTWSQSILILACTMNSLRIINYLLDQGVSIESADGNGWTCLFYAIKFKRLSVIKLLLARGVNLKHKDYKEQGALHIAVDCMKKGTPPRYLEIIELLIDEGVDVNATDINGLTPINMVTTGTFQYESIISWLLLGQHNIDLIKPDVNGITFLHRAVSGRFLLVNIQNLYKLNFDMKYWYNTYFCKRSSQPCRDFTIKNNISIMLELGANVEDLFCCSKYLLLKTTYFLKILEIYRLKRKVANLSNDRNVDTVLAKSCVLSKEENAKLVEIFSNEIERMKETQLCDELTYYDFLHAKKRALIKVAKRFEIRKMFIKDDHKFAMYGFMLCKNYLSGVRPLTSTESKALKDVEENLDVIFNNNLPNLVTYNIKKYIEIEDMMTLNKINTI